MEKFMRSFAIATFALVIVSYITGNKIDLKTAIMSEVVCGGLHYYLDPCADDK